MWWLPAGQRKAGHGSVKLTAYLLASLLVHTLLGDFECLLFQGAEQLESPESELRMPEDWLDSLEKVQFLGVNVHSCSF